MDKNIHSFHYEVRFNLLVLPAGNQDLQFQNRTQVFDENGPLSNREEAFDCFEDYLSFLKANKRLVKDKRGNFVINKPSDAPEFPNKYEDFEEDFSQVQKVEKFRETVGVWLIIHDDELVKTIMPGGRDEENITREFLIHQVASYSFDEQDIIDNLDFEASLFKNLNIGDNGNFKEVYHFGVDYAESGEEEDAAKYRILATPHIWCSEGEYLKAMASKETDEVEISPVVLDNQFSLKDIIDRGEGSQVEFKSSLLDYMTKDSKDGPYVSFEIAKVICAFLNTKGGLLLVGVRDDKSIKGLSEFDYAMLDVDDPRDKLKLKLDSMLTFYFGASAVLNFSAEIIETEGKDVLIIEVDESKYPVFIQNKSEGSYDPEFYIRRTASTIQVRNHQELVAFTMEKMRLKHWH